MKERPFDGAAFDLDGTLYPNYRFYARLLPFLLKGGWRYLLAFGRARNRLRKEPAPARGAPDWGVGRDLPGPAAGGADDEMPVPGPGAEPAPPSESELFYLKQARYMGEILSKPTGEIAKKNEELIYQGWEPHFRKIRPYAHALETLRALKEGGLALGLLSDFPPETKLEYMGLGGLWDAVLSSESVGRLKPDPAPFAELARRMGLPPGKILYVGNSFAYDVLGAKGAGMGAAWIRPCLAWPFWKGPAGRRGRAADLVFHDYRQLRDYMLP